MRRSGSHPWDISGKSLLFPPVSSIQQDKNGPDPQGILWNLGVNPCGKMISTHMWEGGTSALLSNYINRDTPETIEL